MRSVQALSDNFVVSAGRHTSVHFCGKGDYSLLETEKLLLGGVLLILGAAGHDLGVGLVGREGTGHLLVLAKHGVVGRKTRRGVGCALEVENGVVGVCRR